jgi:hypothetical protein
LPGSYSQSLSSTRPNLAATAQALLKQVLTL